MPAVAHLEGAQALYLPTERQTTYMPQALLRFFFLFAPAGLNPSPSDVLGPLNASAGVGRELSPARLTAAGASTFAHMRGAGTGAAGLGAAAGAGAREEAVPLEEALRKAAAKRTSRDTLLAWHTCVDSSFPSYQTAELLYFALLTTYIAAEAGAVTGAMGTPVMGAYAGMGAAATGAGAGGAAGVGAGAGAAPEALAITTLYCCCTCNARIMNGRAAFVPSTKGRIRVGAVAVCRCCVREWHARFVRTH